jgi:hypothetical protein
VSVSFDAGALWSLPLLNAEVGAVIKSIGDGPNSSVDAGVCKKYLRNSVIVTADLIDILDNSGQNYLDKFHAGVQFRAAVLALRAGISAKNPTLGLGIDTRMLDIDAAWFKDEYSGDEERMLVQLKIGW